MTTTEPSDLPIEVSLLTGFLGSGKTTLLNRLVKHPDMGETAVLVNEFGEIGLDHVLVEQVDEDTVLLNAGCICCSVRGDLSLALGELFYKRMHGEVPKFRRVLIETTGLADPAPVIHTLLTDEILVERYALDAVLATVDAANAMNQLDQHAESVKQVALADRVLVTKADLADAGEKERLLARLRALNPAAPLYEVAHGEIAPDRLFAAGLYDPETKSVDARRWLKAEAYTDAHADHDHGHGHDHDHGHEHGHEHGPGEHHHHHHDVNRHDDRIRAFSITVEEPLTWAALVGWITQLIDQHGADLLRLKGIVSIAGEERPMAIHGVHHLFHAPTPLPRWPDDDRRSKIVVIARDVDPAEIDRRLHELQAIAKAAG